MNDLFHNFHFLRPWLLVFLLLPLLLFFKKLKTGGNASSWADVCDKNLLNFLLVSNSGQRHFSVKKLIYTGLAVAAIAAIIRSFFMGFICLSSLLVCRFCARCSSGRVPAR